MNDFDFSEFIHMGGYAKYVWSSWAITVIGMVWMAVSSIRKRQKIYQTIWQQNQQAEARLKRAKSEQQNAQ